MTIERVTLLYDQRRYDLAEEEARRVLASDPENPLAHALRSLALSQLDRLEDATEEAEAAIAAEPTLVLAHRAHAAALRRRNRFAVARRAAAEAVRLDPSDPDSYLSLAAVDLANGKWAAAYEATGRGLAIVGDHAGLLEARSVASAQLGKLDEATDASSAALRQHPDEASALATRGYQLMHRGRFKEARAEFTAALQRDPNQALARAGLVETIKATNPVYSVILRYFLWMSRLPTWQQLLVVFGGPAIFRSLRRTLDADPGTAWLVAPLIAVWLLLVLSTWLATPLSNLALFVHPLGRHALDDEERLEASIIGGLLVLAIAGLALFVAGIGAGVFLMVATAAVAVATAGAFRASQGWPRWVLGAIAVVVAVTGAAAATLAYIRPEGIGETSPAWPVFLVAIGLAVLSSWLAQWLMRVQPAR